ncbi:hypothetical protein L195_g063429, partial [Trifolium pratense]
ASLFRREPASRVVPSSPFVSVFHSPLLATLLQGTVSSSSVSIAISFFSTAI